MAISSPQYVWALFTKPSRPSSVSVWRSSRSLSRSLLVLQTFAPAAIPGGEVRAEATSLGAFFTGGSWVRGRECRHVASLAFRLRVLGGIGTGTHLINRPHGEVVSDSAAQLHRLVAAGYGMGAVLTTFPISISLAASAIGIRSSSSDRCRRLIAALALENTAERVRYRTREPARTFERPRCGAEFHAENADFLASVPDDDDDVHLGVDGDLSDGCLRQGLRRS